MTNGQPASMIRPYHPSDRSALLEIFQLNTPRWFHPDEQKDLEHYLDEYSATYFVAEVNGKIIGAGGYHIAENKTGRISWYMFHPGFQGKGFGRKQVEHSLAILKQHLSPEKIEVWTSQLQHEFYGKFGFVTIETKDDFWGPGMHLYRMEMSANSTMK
jgi:[ribosomal protein S18]-alanine N-acetyltransferase